MWFSIIAWFIFIGIYSAVYPSITMAADMAGQAYMVFSCGVFWMLLFLVPVVALWRDVAWKAFKRTLFKSFAEEVQEAEVKLLDPTAIIQRSVRKRLHALGGKAAQGFNETSRLLNKLFKRTPSSSRRVAEHFDMSQHGYAFSQEEHGAIAQGEVIRVFDSTKRPEGAVVIQENR